MIKTRVSDSFGDLLAKFLADNLATKAMGLFGLKVATPPRALAECIFEMAGSLTRQLDQTVAKWPDALKRDALSCMVLGDDATREIVCAFYSQAVAVMRQGKPQDELMLFQIYTAKTFDEMCGLLRVPDNSLRELVHETSELYFNDRPTLAELARQMPEYVFPFEVKNVLDMNHWMAAFVLKAKIRILGGLRVNNKQVVYTPFSLLISTCFLQSIKFFGRIRPALLD
jgi:hypothetical protein